jgi:hypothetical protein
MAFGDVNGLCMCEGELGLDASEQEIGMTGC